MLLILNLRLVLFHLSSISYSYIRRDVKGILSDGTELVTGGCYALPSGLKPCVTAADRFCWV